MLSRASRIGQIFNQVQQKISKVIAFYTIPSKAVTFHMFSSYVQVSGLNGTII